MKHRIVMLPSAATPSSSTLEFFFEDLLRPIGLYRSGKEERMVVEGLTSGDGYEMDEVGAAGRWCWTGGEGWKGVWNVL